MMKKYLDRFSVIMVICALMCVFLTSCDKRDDSSKRSESKSASENTSVEGQWYCVKLINSGNSMTDKECIEQFGMGLYKLCSVYLDEGGFGHLVLFSAAYTFDWEGTADDLSVKFDRDIFATSSLSLTDGQLVVTINDGPDNFVIYFEKTASFDKNAVSENNPEAFEVYERKSKLKSANTNAKLVFTTSNGAAMDLIADGNSSLITPEVFSGTLPINAAEGEPNKEIKDAIDKTMNERNCLNGSVAFEINSDNKIVWAHWSEEKIGTVGQYPNPETDPDAEHTVGERFDS